MIYRREQHCNIVVTQPRRLAAISICDTVCKDRKWDLGSICGFKVCNQKTSYCTHLAHFWRDHCGKLLFERDLLESIVGYVLLEMYQLAVISLYIFWRGFDLCFFFLISEIWGQRSRCVFWEGSVHMPSIVSKRFIEMEANCRISLDHLKYD